MNYPNKIVGFFIFWFGFALTSVAIYWNYVREEYLSILPGLVLPVFIMLYGLYRMSGSKFSLSYSFWKEKFGGGYPLHFGAVLDFYVGMALLAVMCIILVVIEAPTLVQKLFALLCGNTAVCLLIYFKLKNRRKID
ncbi:MAG: hypothetical protein HXS48_18035 [Theionarchaea archaeon]|nr:hypothetical protein [Theionarchaea archaeon]